MEPSIHQVSSSLIEGLILETETRKKIQSMKCKPAFAFGFAFYLLSSPFLSALSQYEEPKYNYNESSGRGPSRWGTLKPEWIKCSLGKQQSPINIGIVQPRLLLGDLQTNYASAPAVLKNATVYVEVEWLGNAGNITINGTVYKVDNIHWHSPSEHTFNGTRYPLELHLVHHSPQNRTAVVAILYQYGQADLFLNRLYVPILSLGLTNKPLVDVNPEDIEFPGRWYYRNLGSLTTPPCTENVVWTIFEQVKTVSRKQVEALRNVLPPQNRNNSRPVQPLNGRPVLFYPRIN